MCAAAARSAFERGLATARRLADEGRLLEHEKVLLELYAADVSRIGGLATELRAVPLTER